MGLQIETTVFCNECGYAPPGADPRQTAAEIRRVNEGHGWVNIIDADYCPDCAKKLEAKGVIWHDK